MEARPEWGVENLKGPSCRQRLGAVEAIGGSWGATRIGEGDENSGSVARRLRDDDLN